MDGGIATVLAAVIGSFVTLAGIIYQMMSENRRDHGIVASKLDSVGISIERVETKVDTHITDHARGML